MAPHPHRKHQIDGTRPPKFLTKHGINETNKKMPHNDDEKAMLIMMLLTVEYKTNRSTILYGRTYAASAAAA